MGLDEASPVIFGATKSEINSLSEILK